MRIGINTGSQWNESAIPLYRNLKILKVEKLIRLQTAKFVKF